jgi:hypothetical protein
LLVAGSLHKRKDIWVGEKYDPYLLAMTMRQAKIVTEKTPENSVRRHVRLRLD